jgi:KDO2-lipid IV(A) lauroyltransferase
MKKVFWMLEAVFVLAVSLPFAVLPYRISVMAGELLGLLIFLAWGSRRKIAVDNIRNSLPLLQGHGTAVQIAQMTFRYLGRSFTEMVKIYYGLGRALVESVEVRGTEHYRSAKEKGKGVIIITGHCGNWEMAAIVFGSRVGGIYGVARKQDNPYLNAFVAKMRGVFGNRIIYKQGALKSILRVLRDDGNVGILMDQAVVKDEGYIVDFLGRGAWTTKMPALIARKTGAAVIPAFLHREGRRQVFTIHPEVPLSEHQDTETAIIEDTKKFNGILGEYIRAHPAEWLWIHRRWKRV